MGIILGHFKRYLTTSSPPQRKLLDLDQFISQDDTSCIEYPIREKEQASSYTYINKNSW